MHNRIWVAALVCLALAPAAAPAAAAASPSVLDTLIRQADFWRQKGRNDLAADAYRRALGLDPTSAKAKAGLAQVLGEAPRAGEAKSASAAGAGPAAADPELQGFSALKANNLTAAEARFRAARARRPGDADALGGLGVVYLRQGRFAEARDALARAARENGAKWREALRTADFYADLQAAQAALGKADLDEAERLARDLESRGDDATMSAGRLLADVLMAKGGYQDAATLYRAASERAQNGSDAAALRSNAVRAEARLAQVQGQSNLALAKLRAGIAENGADAWLRHDYAQLLLSEGHDGEAVEAVEPLAGGDKPEGLYAAALIFSEMGKSEMASRLLTRIQPQQMSPQMRDLAIDVEVREGVIRAKALADSGRTAEALAALESLARRPGLQPGAESELAQAMSDLGKTGAALELALGAAKDRRGQPASYAGAVVVLARAGQEKTAAELIDDLASRYGSSQAVRRLRALAVAASADRLRAEGQLATAFDLLQAAWAVAPDDDDLLGATARLYETGRMPAQAGELYQRIVRKHPEQVSAWLGLARAAAASNAMALARDALVKATTLAKSDANVFVSASDIAAQLGDRRAAVAYLAQARKLAMASDALAGDGGFPARNPFTNAARPTDLPGASANPFLLASRPSRAVGSAPLSDEKADRGGERQAAPALAPPALQTIAGMGLPGASGANASGDDGAPAFALLGRPAPSAEPLAQDSTLAAINQRLDTLERADAPEVDTQVAVRNRNGESGLSALSEVSANLRAQGQLAGVKVAVSASPVVLEAGAMSRSALARFGTNATAQALGVVAKEPAQLAPAGRGGASGVGLTVTGSAGGVTAEAGVTPLGFERVNVTGRVALEEKLAPGTTVSLYAERKPVTDSVTSYAGSRDPVTGKAWGSVMRSQVGAALASDWNGSGYYVQANGRTYDGQSVKANRAAEINAGAYVASYRTNLMSLTLGANVNFSGYRYNQNYFTFGYGGYFSPQNSAAVSLPIILRAEQAKWRLELNVAPGYQIFNEAAAPVYPTLPNQQALLNQEKALNPDVLAQYDSTGRHGFAVSGGLSGDYAITAAQRLNLGVTYDTFGPYNELQVMLGLRQAFGGDRHEP